MGVEEEKKFGTTEPGSESTAFEDTLDDIIDDDPEDEDFVDDGYSDIDADVKDMNEQDVILDAINFVMHDAAEGMQHFQKMIRELTIPIENDEYVSMHQVEIAASMPDSTARRLMRNQLRPFLVATNIEKKVTGGRSLYAYQRGVNLLNLFAEMRKNNYEIAQITELLEAATKTKNDFDTKAHELQAIQERDTDNRIYSLAALTAKKVFEIAMEEQRTANQAQFQKMQESYEAAIKEMQAGYEAKLSALQESITKQNERIDIQTQHYDDIAQKFSTATQELNAAREQLKKDEEERKRQEEIDELRRQKEEAERKLQESQNAPEEKPANKGFFARLFGKD